MKAKVVLLILGSFLYGGTALWAFNTAELRSLESPVPSFRIAQNWDELSPRERARALDNYRRFKRLPPDKQQGLEKQYNRWQELPNEERDRIRRNYDRYRKMDSDQKEEFFRKYKSWQSAPR